MIVAKGNGNSYYCPYQMFVFADGSVKVIMPQVVGKSSCSQQTEAGYVPLNQWTHIAWVMEGSTSKIYKNGGSLETADFSGCSRISDNSDLNIGRRGDGWADSYFNGRIDEVRIHNRALDPSEFNLLPTGNLNSILQNNLIVYKVLARPNPVRTASVNFKIDGSGVTSIRLVIYTLSGRLVFSSNWQPGDTLEWNLRDNNGRLVANGVYLYVIQIQGINGEKKKSKVQPLFILR